MLPVCLDWPFLIAPSVFSNVYLMIFLQCVPVPTCISAVFYYTHVLLVFFLQVLEGSEGHHFMILFRDHSCQYRSLYMYYADTDFIIKLHGVGPSRITNSMVEKFYK